MAYKFQLGNAKLGGTLQQGGGLVSTDVDDSTAVNIIAEIDSGAIPIAKLAASTISGKALGTNLDALTVGNTSGLSMSSYTGAAAVSNLTVVLKGESGGTISKDSSGLFIADNAISSAKLAGSIASAKIADLSTFTTAHVGEGSNLYYTDARVRAAISRVDSGGDGSFTYNASNGVMTYAGPSAAEVRAHFSADVSSNGGRGSLAYSNGVFAYEGVTQAEIRGDISVTDSGGDGSLAYNNGSGVITYVGPSASETRAHISIADTNSMDFSYSSGQISAALKLKSGGALEVDGSGLDLKATISGNRTFSGDLIISGDLTVNGTNTILNTTTLEVEDLNIKVAKLAANSAAADGAGLTIEMGANDLTFQWLHAGSRMELKMGSDYSNLKANKFIGGLEGAVSSPIEDIADVDATLVVGFNYGAADTTALRTWTLPVSPEPGQVVHVKAPSSVHADGIKILKAGSQLIDGAAFILLESPFAAVNLMYVANNIWRVY